MRQRPRLAAHAARGTAALRLMTHPDPRPRARSALEDAAAVPPRLKLEEMQLEEENTSLRDDTPATKFNIGCADANQHALAHCVLTTARYGRPTFATVFTASRAPAQQSWAAVRARLLDWPHLVDDRLLGTHRCLLLSSALPGAQHADKGP